MHTTFPPLLLRPRPSRITIAELPGPSSPSTTTPRTPVAIAMLKLLGGGLKGGAVDLVEQNAEFRKESDKAEKCLRALEVFGR